MYIRLHALHIHITQYTGRLLLISQDCSIDLHRNATHLQINALHLHTSSQQSTYSTSTGCSSTTHDCSRSTQDCSRSTVHRTALHRNYLLLYRNALQSTLSVCTEHILATCFMRYTYYLRYLSYAT